MKIYTASKEKGRFISEDPIKGSMTNSQSQNPYVYCMNNPLRYVDPSGMSDMEVPSMPVDEWLMPSNQTAAELLNNVRSNPDYYRSAIDEAYNEAINGSYDYWDYVNLDPVLPDKQNPIGGHVYASGPLTSANGYGLYDSKTKDWDARLHVNLLGGMSTPGAGITLIDLDVGIDEFKSISKTVSGNIEIPIAKTGANLVIDKAYYDKYDEDTITTHRLYSGLGLSIGKKGIPGGGISTYKGINIIFGLGREEGFYCQIYRN